MSKLTRCLIASAVISLLSGLPRIAAAEEPDPGSTRDLMYEDRIAELERTVEVLADELQRTRTALAVPEDPVLESAYGMGPAASKVYRAGRGLTLGGYGEAFYSNALGDQGSGVSKTRDRADMLRLVLYAGYRFTENIVFNSEIEFEHATTSSTESSSGGSASVEFAALDFFWKDWANFRAGLLLAPMGFLNEIHEPPFFYGVSRPDVERVLIPTTWRELGTGLFGHLGEDIEYQAYVMNGFNGKGFDSRGVRGGRQKGNRVLAEHLAFVGQLNWYATPEWMLGASLYLGNSGQNQRLTSTVPGGTLKLPNARTTIWDVHSQFDWRRLHLRGLFTMTHIDQAGRLTSALRMVPDGGGTELGANEAIASWMLGGYAEVAYDILPLFFPETSRSLSPFYRYEFYDTQWDMPSGFSSDDRREIQVHTMGMQFKPIPSVVIKADYRNRDSESGQIADELNLGVGLVF